MTLMYPKENVKILPYCQKYLTVLRLNKKTSENKYVLENISSIYPVLLPKYGLELFFLLSTVQLIKAIIALRFPKDEREWREVYL